MRIWFISSIVVYLMSFSQMSWSFQQSSCYRPDGSLVRCPVNNQNSGSRRALETLGSSCEYRARNGEVTQGKVMQTVDNKNVCVIDLSDLKQVGESCQLGIYNGWNPLRNWQVSGTVSQQNNALSCSVSEIPAEPQLPRPPLPTQTQLLNLQ
ncbi:MAG: hypothetical protein RIT27_1191 [Pseudomonadota bacterium]|jgi:hypothetical protein